MTTTKSLSVSNLDLVSPLRATTGEGGVGNLRELDDYVTAAAADPAGTIYLILRVPSNAKLKALVLESEAQGAGKINVGLYYSSSKNDGTQVALQGTALSTALFATDVDLASAVTPTNITNESGSYTLDKRNQPLWKAAGLSTDPGGMFDIAATVHTTDITTGTGKIGLRAEFVE